MAEEHKRMRQLQATEAEWQAQDPTLLDGEIAFSSDVRKYKVGPGVWSGLPYWDGGALGDAPVDGFLYGRVSGQWGTAVGYSDSYSGDVDLIPDASYPIYYHLHAPITNGWSGISEGDHILHMYDHLTGNAVQTGYSHSGTGNEAGVIYTRVRRGSSWSGWLSKVLFDTDAYVGSLDNLTGSAEAYIITVHTGPGASGGWPSMTAGSPVYTLNIDANTAQQIGFVADTVWLRAKNGGVWSDWKRPQVLESDITDLDRVRWRGNWVDGNTYEKNDMVLDNPWTMIANKQTTDRAGPQPEGNPEWDFTDTPIWDSPNPSFLGQVRSGREWDVTELTEVKAIQVWVPEISDDITYNVFGYYHPTGSPDRREELLLDEGTLRANEWVTIPLRDILFLAGTTFGAYIEALNSAVDTVFEGNWTREANSNDATADPGVGGWGSSNTNLLLRFNYTDNNTVDFTTDLQSVTAGSTITIVQADDLTRWMRFSINAAGVDQGAHISFENITPSATGPNGEPVFGAACEISVAVPTPDTTEYVELVGGNPTVPFGTARGLLVLDGVPQSVDANAYGVRVLTDDYIVSPDWDVVSSIGSGGGGGGGGGGDGASTFTELSDTPADYAGQAGNAVLVNQTEDGLIFGPGGGGASTFDALTDTPTNKTGAAQQIPMVNIGETALEYVPQGVTAFDTSHTYVRDDVISYQGVLYFCISDTPVTGTFNPDDWSPAGTPTGSGVTLRYEWRTATSGDPGSGGFAITDPMANPTNTLRISDINERGLNAGPFWQNIQTGDYISFIEDTGGAESGVWEATGPGVIQAGWTDIPVQWVNNVGEPENNRKGFALIVQNPNAKIPAGGDAGDVLRKASATDFDTEWWDITAEFDTRYAPIVHTHVISDVTGLQTELDGKVAKAGDTMTGALNIDTADALRLGFNTAVNPYMGWYSSGVRIGYMQAIESISGLVISHNNNAVQFYIQDDDATLIVPSPSTTPAAESVITRGRGDARYALKGEGGGGPAYSFGDTAPVNPSIGDRWYCTFDGAVGMYTYTDDGDSEQWVQQNGGDPGPQGPPGPAAGPIQEFHDPTDTQSWRIVGNTLECWGKIPQPLPAANITINFAKTFARPPVVHGAGAATGNLARDMSPRSNNITTTSVEIFCVIVSSGAAATDMELHWHAIGEWDGVS